MQANTPDERAVTRAAIAAKRMAESKALNKLKRRLRARTDIGKDWDGAMVHENKFDWPLSKAMLSDGNHELLRVAIKYRAIHDKAAASPMLGDGAPPIGELTILHRLVDRGDGTMVSHGEVVLKSTAPTEYPAQRAAQTLATSKQRATPIPKPWAGDGAVNDAIDARSLLSALRGRLGPLAEPLEMAVVDGATLQECGNAAGIANRAGAMGAGKALVYNALIMASVFLAQASSV